MRSSAAYMEAPDRPASVEERMSGRGWARVGQRQKSCTSIPSCPARPLRWAARSCRVLFNCLCRFSSSGDPGQRASKPQGLFCISFNICSENTGSLLCHGQPLPFLCWRGASFSQCIDSRPPGSLSHFPTNSYLSINRPTRWPVVSPGSKARRARSRCVESRCRAEVWQAAGSGICMGYLPET